MDLLTAAAWGLVGSAVAEALNSYSMMRPTTESRGRWQWPWRDRRDRPIILFAIFLRTAAATGVATAAFSGNLVDSAFALFVLGLASPLLIAKMFDQVRVLDSASTAPSLTTPAGFDQAERRVLAVMTEGVSYDESQISSAALMSPSELSTVVRNLVGKGALQEEAQSSEEPRYRLARPGAAGE
ncbi:hypothetical protein [Plantactinospora endophytica]|uniref:MarR family transcriptional regulator n=1 Tax=Plantactinospora endophytica TaxID=673535 RepID=A0ABQ4E0A6_9ACTN|nr:hypothetical protein [Plantactinospora endophytica]GIG88106.1 hypothetical protein Pen02_30420 [Plantactinospora endophytica]